MTTEKFLCQKCTCICLLSISFNQGDEKTKSALTCPLQFTYHDFRIVDKSPERAIIKTEFNSTQNQLSFLKRRSRQLDYLKLMNKIERALIRRAQALLFEYAAEELERVKKEMMKDCSKCIYAIQEEFCFSKCRGFSEYRESAPDDNIIRDRGIESEYRESAPDDTIIRDREIEIKPLGEGHTLFDQKTTCIPPIPDREKELKKKSVDYRGNA